MATEQLLGFRVGNEVILVRCDYMDDYSAHKNDAWGIELSNDQAEELRNKLMAWNKGEENLVRSEIY